MSAIRSCTIWNSPIHWPNCRRSRANATLASSAARRMPTAPAATEMRPKNAMLESDDEKRAAQIPAIAHHIGVAVALRPRSGFVRAMLATALALQKRYREGAEQMDIATQLEPASALVWLLRAGTTRTRRFRRSRSRRAARRWISSRD